MLSSLVLAVRIPATRIEAEFPRLIENFENLLSVKELKLGKGQDLVDRSESLLAQQRQIAEDDEEVAEEEALEEEDEIDGHGDRAA